MRITVEIDDDLMDEALRVSAIRTKKAAIEEALREFVRRRRIEQLRKMVGTDAIDLTLEDLRRMRGK
jgi:Arc/MetJ family transcription regulator